MLSTRDFTKTQTKVKITRSSPTVCIINDRLMTMLGHMVRTLLKQLTNYLGPVVMLMSTFLWTKCYQQRRIWCLKLTLFSDASDASSLRDSVESYTRKFRSVIEPLETLEDYCKPNKEYERSSSCTTAYIEDVSYRQYTPSLRSYLRYMLYIW